MATVLKSNFVGPTPAELAAQKRAAMMQSLQYAGQTAMNIRAQNEIETQEKTKNAFATWKSAKPEGWSDSRWALSDAGKNMALGLAKDIFRGDEKKATDFVNNLSNIANVDSQELVAMADQQQVLGESAYDQADPSGGGQNVKYVEPDPVVPTPTPTPIPTPTPDPTPPAKVTPAPVNGDDLYFRALQSQRGFSDWEIENDAKLKAEREDMAKGFRTSSISPTMTGYSTIFDNAMTTVNNPTDKFKQEKIDAYLKKSVPQNWEDFLAWREKLNPIPGDEATPHGKKATVEKQRELALKNPETKKLFDKLMRNPTPEAWQTQKNEWLQAAAYRKNPPKQPDGRASVSPPSAAEVAASRAQTAAQVAATQTGNPDNVQPSSSNYTAVSSTGDYLRNQTATINPEQAKPAEDIAITKATGEEKRKAALEEKAAVGEVREKIWRGVGKSSFVAGVRERLLNVNEMLDPEGTLKDNPRLKALTMDWTQAKMNGDMATTRKLNAEAELLEKEAGSVKAVAQTNYLKAQYDMLKLNSENMAKVLDGAQKAADPYLKVLDESTKDLKGPDKIEKYKQTFNKLYNDLPQFKSAIDAVQTAQSDLGGWKLSKQDLIYTTSWLWMTEQHKGEVVSGEPIPGVGRTKPAAATARSKDAQDLINTF